MTATYTVRPGEMGMFLKTLQKTFARLPLRVTVETLAEAEAPEETRARMRRALDAAQRGDFVHTMSIDTLEAMAQ